MNDVWVRAPGFELPAPELFEQFNAVIYTDGSCSASDRVGGWAWVSLDPDGAIIEHSSGHARDTTISRMELTAVVQALWAHQLGKVVVFSDSQYSVNAIGRWAPGWRANGWRTSVRRVVQHADLVDMGNQLLERGGSSLRWVKGHRQELGNLRADELAGAARAKALGATKTWRVVEDTQPNKEYL